MGMLRDLRATSKAAKGLSSDWEPGAQMRHGLSMMQRMTETLQEQAEAVAHRADMVQARATVLRLTPTGASINDARVVRIDLLVWLPDGSQRPAVLSCALELTELASYQPGTSIEVRIDPAHPDRVLLSR